MEVVVKTSSPCAQSGAIILPMVFDPGLVPARVAIDAAARVQAFTRLEVSATSAATVNSPEQTCEKPNSLLASSQVGDKLLVLIRPDSQLQRCENTLHVTAQDGVSLKP